MNCLGCIHFLIGNREYTEQVGEYVGRKVLAALGNT